MPAAVHAMRGGRDRELYRRQVHLATVAKVNLIIKLQWVLRDLNRKKKEDEKHEDCLHLILKSLALKSLLFSFNYLLCVRQIPSKIGFPGQNIKSLCYTPTARQTLVKSLENQSPALGTFFKIYFIYY